MKLTVQEVALLLGGDEEKVYGWIERSDLPAQRIRGQYWINRTELLEWATEHNIAIAPRAFARAGDGGTPSLADALRAGGIYDRVASENISDAMRAIVALLPLEDEVDRETLLEVVLARDSFGFAGIGGGIAIPHVRTPIILSPRESVAALAFLVKPLTIPTPDDRPIDTLFFLISPTVHAHLAMLAKLAFCLKTGSFRAALERRAPSEEILRIAAAAEEAA